MRRVKMSVQNVKGKQNEKYFSVVNNRKNGNRSILAIDACQFGKVVNVRARLHVTLLSLFSGKSNALKNLHRVKFIDKQFKAHVMHL